MTLKIVKITMLENTIKLGKIAFWPYLINIVFMQIKSFFRNTGRQNFVNHVDHIRGQIQNMGNNLAILNPLPVVGRNQNLGGVTIGFIFKIVPA